METDWLDFVRNYYRRYINRPGVYPAVAPSIWRNALGHINSDRESYSDQVDFEPIMVWLTDVIAAAEHENEPNLTANSARAADVNTSSDDAATSDTHQVDEPTNAQPPSSTAPTDLDVTEFGGDDDSTDSPFLGDNIEKLRRALEESDAQSPSPGEPFSDEYDDYAIEYIDDDGSVIPEERRSVPTLVDALTNASQDDRPRPPGADAKPIDGVETPTPPSWALFDPQLDPERRKDLLGQLEHWYREHFVEFGFRLPPCVMMHQGPLVGLFAAYSLYNLTNRAAREGSAHAYLNYYNFIVQLNGTLVAPKGAFNAELLACLTKGSHVEPDTDPLDVDQTVEPSSYPSRTSGR